METHVRIDVSRVIDNSTLNSFHWGIFILTTLCLITDGYDVQTMGYVAPALVRDWKISGAALGPVFSAALLGVLFGSLGFSVLADKIGRRPVLIIATLYFSALTLCTGIVPSVEWLLWIRFFAGIGLGGIIPNAMSLVGEYSPAKHRVTVMMIVSCGFTAGAALSGFVSAWLIPAFGWRSVFYLGAGAPFVIALVMVFKLPESLQFMVLRGKNKENLGRWLKRADPTVSIKGDIEFAVQERKQEGFPVFHLFRERRSRTTILFWIVNFMNLLNLYFLSSWIPTVVGGAGYSARTAVLVGTSVQVGGTIGSFGNAWLIGQFGFIRALTINFVVAFASIASIGRPGLPLAVLYGVVFISGWCIVGGQPGINALAAVYYPTYLRSTGIGWGLGIGRIGAVVGPLLGGELIQRHWSTQVVFYAAAVPALISAVAMLDLWRRNVVGRTRFS
jgi:AAHS family 4-hydroxybenzoate transporter-like MFS transporter